MKKITACIMLALMLLLTLSASAFATGETSPSYVTDEAGLLTSQQKDELDSKAASISKTYDCGVYIVTVDDFSKYNYSSIEPFAEAVFNSNELGIGSERNGVLLVLSMASRDYSLIAHGNFGNASFTDYGKEVMSGNFLDDFGENDWYDGFSDYLASCESYLSASASGAPFDVDTDPDMVAASKTMKTVIIIVVPLLVALIVCSIFKAQMKTAHKKTEASDYVVQGSEELRIREDVFTHRTRTVETIETNNNSHSGGTTVNSGGFSSRSGKF